VALTVLQVAYAIFLETSIAFLGLGDPRLTSWGKLIENAFLASAISRDAWWAIVPPGFAVVIVVLACTMVGRAVEDALNPRLRVGHVSVHRFGLRALPRP
jgi:peptide/nickel transport system permease protein